MKIDNSNINKFIFQKPIVVILCCAFASGCAVDPKTGQPSFKETFASDDPCSNNARNIGIGVGALVGAVLGNQVKHSNNARLLGAALGATAGGLIGYDMDKRRCELSKIAKQYNLDIQVSTVKASGEVIDDATLKNIANATDIKSSAVGSAVEVSDQSLDGGHFESNSDVLTPKAQQYFAAIADSYKFSGATDPNLDPKTRADLVAQNSKRKLFLVGHTDDTGSSSLNAELSERRAKVVAKFMEDRGIPSGSIYFQGAGEFYPIATNVTEEGRAKNRRVEIIEVTDIAAFDKYLAARKPRYDFYRSNDEIVAAGGTLDKSSVSSQLNNSKQAATNPVVASKNNSDKQISSSAAQSNVSQVASGKPVVSNPKAATGNINADSNIDFGGVALNNDVATADIGKIQTRSALFSLISSAYAEEPAAISDCTQDRPRAANGVKSLSNGKTYRISEYVPGLYGKTWTDQVNGHQIVMNKIAVLANDGSLANPPEFKVYTNYNQQKNRNPLPDLTMKPDVNTYLGSKGVLYRMFINGQSGMQCVDVVFTADGSKFAKAGKLVYTHDDKLYMADFKPKMY